MIKILIADDQELIRQSLQIVLNTKEDMDYTIEKVKMVVADMRG